MFDIGAAELLVIVVVAILVIGPKDMPMALRTAGRWIGKVRSMSSHFRSGIDAMIREAELEEAEKEWKARNAKVMAEHPDRPDKIAEPENLLPEEEMQATNVHPPQPVVEPTSEQPGNPDTAAEAAIARAAPKKAPEHGGDPELPLDTPAGEASGKPKVD